MTDASTRCTRWFWQGEVLHCHFPAGRAVSSRHIRYEPAEAPPEIRGEVRPIATSVPDCRICEHMPLVARQAHHLTVLRAVHHDDTQHNNAGYAALTGTHPPLLPNTVEALAGPRPDNHPPFGAVLARLRSSPVPWIALPYPCINGIPYPGQ